MKIAVICNTMNEYHKAKMGLGVTLRNAGMDLIYSFGIMEARTIE